MPQVPTYQRPTVETQGLQNVRVAVDRAAFPIEAFGGGAANAGFQGTSVIADSVGRIVAEEKRNADQIAFQDYDAKVSQLQTSLQIKASEMRGKDASGAIDHVNQEWSKGLEELDKTLANDSQRVAARRSIANRWESLNKTVQLHMAGERQAYDTESTTAYINNVRNEALASYTDGQAVGDSILRQVGSITEFGRRNGKSEEWVQEQTTKLASQTHLGVISRMLDNQQDLVAQKYFENVKGQIAGGDIAQVERLLEEGSVRGESQRITDGLIKKNLSTADALDDIRNIKNPKVRDAVEQRYKGELATIKSLKAAEQEQIYQGVANIVEQTKSRDSIPLSQWLSLSPSDRVSIDSRIKQLREGVEPESGGEAYYNLRNMASFSESREDFKHLNLLPYRHKMTGSEFEQMIDLQTGLRNGDEKANQVLNGVRSNKDLVDDVLREMDVNPNPKPGSDDAQSVVRFYKLVDDRVVQLQGQIGRKASTQEVQKIADDLATEIVTGRRLGFLWQTRKRKFELSIEDVPSSEKANIEDALRLTGQPVTNENILELYSRRNRAAK